MTKPRLLILAAMVAAVLGLLNAVPEVSAGWLACVGVLCLAGAWLLRA